MVVSMTRRRFTVDEYYRMADIGILSREDRVELLDGTIFALGPIGVRHAACVTLVTDLFYQYTQQPVVIRVQDPVRLGEYSEPQPDVALLRMRADKYSTSHPGPADVLLLIEVADTSLEYDRGMKLPLYAAAGIPEVWIVDLAGEVVETYAQPSGGQYQAQVRAGRGESVTAQSVPGLTLEVTAILG